jgi:hypothetical protein
MDAVERLQKLSARHCTATYTPDLLLHTFMSDELGTLGEPCSVLFALNVTPHPVIVVLKAKDLNDKYFWKQDVFAQVGLNGVQ